MCGIAGFAGMTCPGALERMTGAIVHRGPDDSGVYNGESGVAAVALGHRRLTILDDAGGRQPMTNEDGSVVLVFNGEIYNHRELRAELLARGHVFRSHHSDTEVLVHGYEEWGDGLPGRLNGMFAFALHDRRTGSLFLARDRFGEKPLFYCALPGLFAFASELKALLQHSQVPRSVSRHGMAKLFALGFIPSPSTIIDSVCKLPPGHHLRVELATLEARRTCYWSFRLSPDGRDRPRGEVEAELSHLVRQAVSRRLMGDVPLGVFVSGGLDSSIVLSCAAAGRPPSGELHTFSMGFREASFDESAHARRVAAFFGTTHHEHVLDMDTARAALDPLLDALDEPLGDPSLLPTSLLARFARTHVKVALGGDGADELFAGYDPFRALAPARLYARMVPDAVHRGARRLVEGLPVSTRNMSLDFRLKRTLRALSYPQPLWNPAWLGPLDPEGLDGLFGSRVDREETYREVMHAWSDAGTTSLLDRTLVFYTRLYLADSILTKVDRATMMSSLEGRAPFLDNDLVDFVSALPGRLKLDGFETKSILKSAFRDQLPPGIADRPKKGFGIPLSSWLRNWDDPGFVDRLPGIDRSWLSERWREHRDGVADHRQLLWCAISLDRFIRSIGNPVTA
jgi:asparagine synthase (glutamine-hydrolysing)